VWHRSVREIEELQREKPMGRCIDRAGSTPSWRVTVVTDRAAAFAQSRARVNAVARIWEPRQRSWRGSLLASAQLSPMPARLENREGGPTRARTLVTWVLD